MLADNPNSPLLSSAGAQALKIRWRNKNRSVPIGTGGTAAGKFPP